jgi:serine/threonine-protein kinase
MEDPDSADHGAVAPTLADTLPAGAKVGEVVGGKYRVDSVLGHGGMGVVLAARDLSLDRPVALKLTVGSDDEQAVARFLREARVVARLESEHAVKILDTGRLATGAPYIVMEYLEGETLAQILARRETLPPELLVDYVLEACDAIAEAHSLGIVHRDLKPSNVFLARRADGSERVKVIDFGISKTLDQTPLTHSAAFLGSPQYVAPEQIESARAVDGRADIWALGVILYEGLSGERPFYGATLSELCMNILGGRPAPLHAAGAPIPRALGETVERCLAKRPDDRPATVLQLTTLLAPFASSRGRAVLSRIERLESRASVASAKPARASAVDAVGSSQQTERSWVSASRSHAGRLTRWPASAGLGISLLIIFSAVYAWTRSREAPVEKAPSANHSTSSARETASLPRAMRDEQPAQPEKREPVRTTSAESPHMPPQSTEAKKGASILPSSHAAKGREASAFSGFARATASATTATASSTSATATSSSAPAATEAETPSHESAPIALKSCVASRVSEGGAVVAPSSDGKVTFEWARKECSSSNRSGSFSLDRGSVRIQCQCSP